MHLWSRRPAKADVISAMQSYGVPVWVTEFDSFQLQGPYLPPGMNAEQEQALITQNMIEAALESGVCDCFTNWGFSDKNSWWNNYYGANYNPCLWDVNNNAKLNYYAIQQTLSAKMTLANDLFLPLVVK
jgi:GH35 family endo-1,4-beta-xylanase